MAEQTIPKYDGRGIISGTYVTANQDIDRQQWLEDCYPEWGTFLNQEIATYKVPQGQVGLWWCGGPSWVLKTDEGGIYWIDQYCGPSLYTEAVGNCGVCKQAGAKSINWLRLNPQVIDPWQFKGLDGAFITHMHQDHCDLYAVKAALKTTDVTFYAPYMACKKLRGFEVPDSRIHMARVGESVQLKGATVEFLMCYDDTAIRTTDGPDVLPYELACTSFLFRTSAGNILFLGDTWFNDGYTQIGNDYDIDVAIADMGFNAPGATDKMTPYDCVRVSKALKAKVFIPDHYDNWANCAGDPSMLTRELEYLAKDVCPDTHITIMGCGGRYLYPQDKKVTRYAYPDGSEDYHFERGEVYKRIQQQHLAVSQMLKKQDK